MSQSNYDLLIQYLDSHKIIYSALVHEEVFTSQQAAQVRGTQLHQAAKALIVFADKKPTCLVVPADKKVDTKKFKQQYHIKDLRLATPEEVEQLTNGIKIGAVHPLGTLYNLPVYQDQGLSDNQEIVFSAGTHTHSLKMRYNDYKSLVNPTIGDFAIKKN